MKPGRPRRCVVKVGGSLLRRPGLIDELNEWLAANPSGEHWVLVGGGDLIEAVRRWDQIHRMDPETVHWRCVDLLDTTFEMMRSWFPEWGFVDRFEQVESRRGTGGITLVRPSAIYRRGRDADGVPRDWRTTTDTIAVILGQIIRADEIVLLKSCEIPEDRTIAELSRWGIVDEALPMVAGQSPPIRLARLS